MDETEFLEMCERWYERGDAIRRTAEQIIRNAERIGYTVTYNRSSSKSKNPREDIVAKFAIGGCPMLCIRGYNPEWKPAIQFTHHAKKTQESWSEQSDLFAPTWKSVASMPKEYKDGKISLKLADAVERATVALDAFALIMAKRPTR